MATENLEYLDESGLNKTAANVLAKIAESKAQIEEELNSLSYAQPDGIYPDMTVGAVIGADETAQWATRESDGTGSAIVRSVQGAAVVWNQLTRPLTTTTTAGVTFTSDKDAGTVTLNGTATSSGQKWSMKVPHTQNHKYLLYLHASDYTGLTFAFSIGGPSDTGSGVITTVSTATGDLYVAISIANGHAYDNVVCHPQVFDLTAMFGSGNEPSTVADFERMFPAAYYPYSVKTLKPVQIAGISSTDAQDNALDNVEWPTQTLRAAGSVADMLYADHVDVNVGERAYQSGDESDATVRTDGTTTYYELATPTTTPISPALPMTYRVQQGGSESIIVPDGEISAAPIITVAEGVNVSTELARIWEAIEALQGSRQALQSDVRNDMQEITTDLTPIDVTKEVQQTDENREVSE